MLRAHAEGIRGTLRIGVECYPCYEWLTGAIGRFLDAEPDIEVDILGQVHFSGVEGLIQKQVDMLITPDPHPHPVLRYDALFDYELVLLAAKSHPLGAHSLVEAEDLSDITLFSFPVPNERLDIFTAFFWPASVRPKRHKRLHSVEIMVQMVAHGRGVCALPAWLASRYANEFALSTIQLGSAGIQKTLHAAIRSEDAELPYIQRFVTLGRS